MQLPTSFKVPCVQLPFGGVVVGSGVKVKTGADEAVTGASVLPLVDAGEGDAGTGVDDGGSTVGVNVLAGADDETFSVGTGATVVDGMEVVAAVSVDVIGARVEVGGDVGFADEGAAVRGLVAGSAVVELSTGLTVLMGAFVFVLGA